MNERTAVAVLLCIVATGLQAKDVETRVASVVVYKDGATITRRASVQLPSGAETLRVEGLPPGLDVSDLRLSLSDPSVRLGQVQVAREPRNAAFNDQYRAAERAIQEQQLVLQAIKDDDEAAERELTFLKGFSEGYSGRAGVQGVQGSADPAAWESALVLLREGTRDARARLRSNTLKRIDAERELQRRQSALAQLRGGERRESIVTVDVKSPRAITVSFEMMYDTDLASWGSQYEARVDSTTNTVRFLHTAGVGQRTGENWSNIQLTLSTRAVSGEITAEWPQSEFLNIYTPQPKRMRNAMSSSADQLGEIVVTGSRISRDEAVAVGDYDVIYNIPGRVSIETNSDTANTFEVDGYEAAVSLITTVVPVTAPTAFLEASFTHTADAPIEDGEMRIYLDGALVGSTYVSYVRPGQENRISVGEDRMVQVRVLPQGDYNDNRGVIRRREFRTTHTIYEITNRRSTPTSIEVIGRYPVSENKAIDVKIGDDATPPDETNLEDQPGIIQWKRELAPQESWRITQQYTISYPEDDSLDRDFRVE